MLNDVGTLAGRTASLTGTIFETLRFYAYAESWRRMRYVLGLEQTIVQGQVRSFRRGAGLRAEPGRQLPEARGAGVTPEAACV